VEVQRRRICLACDDASEIFLIILCHDQSYFRGRFLDDCRDRLTEAVFADGKPAINSR
jgi:hypothetical protein